MLYLSLVSQFPLGPSLYRGSLLRPGGRLSRLHRPGGRLSRLLRPGGRLSRLLRPGGRLSRLLRPGGRLCRLLRPGGRLCRLLRPGGRLCRLHRPGGRLSRLLRPGGRLSRLLRPGGRLSRLLRPGGRLTCQSHFTSPPICQSHPTSPPTCQSHPTSPLTCQSHLTSPLTCQSHLTSPLTCQSHLTSPLSHWLLMDLALRSLPWFHLRSTALLDYALCEVSGSRSLGGGALSRIWLPLTTLQLHITYRLHLPSFTAHTHSRPPLHQSHSCHHSLINPDCLITPAPHSLTHIKAAHIHSPIAKSCFAPADILSVSPVFCFPVFTWTAYLL